MTSIAAAGPPSGYAPAEQKIRKTVAAVIIEPSNSPWAVFQKIRDLNIFKYLLQNVHKIKKLILLLCGTASTDLSMQLASKDIQNQDINNFGK